MKKKEVGPLDIPDEKHFRFRDGTTVADLAGLKEKIESISYDEFYGHVNNEKNDFANWVGDVLRQQGLAKKLKEVSSIVETVELLNEALFPDKMGKAEQQLEKEDLPDFQERIEEQLFAHEQEAQPQEGSFARPPPLIGEPSEQLETFSGEIPEVHAVDPEPSVESTDEAMPAPPGEGDGEEVSLPPREEWLPERHPRPAAVSDEPAHVPITEKVDRPVSAEEHMRFLVKQFVYGFILGTIIGFILGVIVSWYT